MVDSEATTQEETTSEETNPIVKAVNGMREEMTALKEGHEAEMKEMKEALAKAKEPVYPNGLPNGTAYQGFGIRKGEDPLTSRPYMVSMAARRLRMQKTNEGDYREVAKPEAELSADLMKHYCGNAGWGGFSKAGFVVPLSASMLPAEDVETDEGQIIPAVPAELRKRCDDMMQLDGGIDYDELRALGLPLRKSHVVALRKDLSADDASLGGTMVAAAAQGELINILRAQEVLSQVGARQLDFPPQGKITFPRVTSTVTISATSEGATISESTPGTGRLALSAKPYSGLTDVPDELMMFASVNTEAWLRSEMMREQALKVDRDSINGGGGIAIQGIINFSGVTTRTAGTTGANGDTLDAPDPTLLHGDLADNNAPVDDGSFFFALTGSLWAGLSTRQATTNEFIFAVAAQAVGGGTVNKSLQGMRVVTSTQLPTDRSKGSGTTLTILLGGVGSEWAIARAGVVQIEMTNSDASKFQSRIQTLRSTQFVDAGPFHEESFGFIDELLDS
jgi:HK97 family phage major capsid protein